MAWPVGLRSDPLFLRAVNYGGQPPIIFRPFLAPNAHRKPRRCSPPVLRLAADLATPLARGRSPCPPRHLPPTFGPNAHRKSPHWTTHVLRLSRSGGDPIS
jgi:hypothetical protein